MLGTTSNGVDTDQLTEYLWEAKFKCGLKKVATMGDTDTLVLAAMRWTQTSLQSISSREGDTEQTNLAAVRGVYRSAYI